MSKGSKFAGILAARKGEATDEAPAAEKAPAAPFVASAKSAAAPAPTEERAPAPRGPGRIGRPATGKRSNPDFEQVGVYLRKDTHHAAKMALLQARDGRDLSDVVEELLTSWLAGSG